MKKFKLVILVLITALAPTARAGAPGLQSSAPAGQAAGQDKAPGPLTLKLERGGKVSISNRSGKITVTGWDRDRIEATATDEEESVQIPVVVNEDQAPGNVRLTVGRAVARNREGQREVRRHVHEADLVVKVPRYASLEIVESVHANIFVSDMQGSVFINQGNGDVDVKRVGSLRIAKQNGDISASGIDGACQIRSLNGEVWVSNVKGPVELGTAAGDVSLSNSGGDARVNTATGDLDLRCVKGRAEANSASGSISLIGVGGDVDANTASGDVIFRGRIQANGRYRLKSISGEIEMSIQPDAPGFIATLSTYSGELETDFPLKIESPSQGRINRRVVGRYGDGQAQLALDSFSGSVRILKGGSGECK